MKYRAAFLFFACVAPAILPAQAGAAPKSAVAVAEEARPLADVLAEIQARFHIRIDAPEELVKGRTLAWADYRIRRYSVDETLRDVLAPFDLMFDHKAGKNYRVIAYDHARRTPGEGARELQYLAAFHKDRATWEEHARALRPALLDALRLNPMPARPRSDLIVTPARGMNGYSVQNFALETLPGVYVCGSVYMPAHAQGKCPLIVSPNGHFPGGRYHNDQQILCATLARMGAYAVGYDLFAWGESLLQFPAGAHRAPMAQTMQILNGLRIIDCFSALPEVDASRIAVTGASGGGSQTMMLAALDERIKASAPVVMVSAYFDGGCPCESGRPVHLAAGGMNNAELSAMAAPRPQLIVSDGKDWTAHVPESEYPFIKHIYGLLGHAENVTNAHLPSEGHDYGPSKRAAVYAFFAAQFGLDATPASDEKSCAIESAAALCVFGEKGERLPANALKGMAELETVFEKAKQPR